MAEQNTSCYCWICPDVAVACKACVDNAAADHVMLSNVKFV